MTKKHYEAIADCIECRLCAKDNHPHEIARRLADYFATDNPKFNRTRFLQACGVEVPECNVIHKTIAELCECTDCEQHFIE